MPVLESFCVDHTKMKAPAVRVAKTMDTPSGDIITVFDLRFRMPNTQNMDEKGTHTLEHLFAGFMREHLNGSGNEIVDISPMGCRTGFYMSVLGQPKEDEVAKAWEKSMRDILDLQSQNQIPELNKYQCGSYQMHSLQNAQNIADEVLSTGVGVMKNEQLKLDANKVNC